MTMNKWNTYRTTAYTFDAANDQRSAGGVHHHQVRKSAYGWQYRILQSNGSHSAAGRISPAENDAQAYADYCTAAQNG